VSINLLRCAKIYCYVFRKYKYVTSLKVNIVRKLTDLNVGLCTVGPAALLAFTPTDAWASEIQNTIMWFVFYLSTSANNSGLELSKKKKDFGCNIISDVVQKYTEHVKIRKHRSVKSATGLVIHNTAIWLSASDFHIIC